METSRRLCRPERAKRLLLLEGEKWNCRPLRFGATIIAWRSMCFLSAAEFLHLSDREILCSHPRNVFFRKPGYALQSLLQ